METILALICNHTSDQVDNRVLVANDRWAMSEERHGRVEVVRVPTLVKIGAVAICPTLPFRLAREKADLIVIHEPNPMGLLAYFLARPAGNLIVWFHSEVIRPSWRYNLFYRPFLRYAFARAARIVIASQNLAASAPQLHEWQSKCVVIPYGIEAGHEAPPAAIVHRADAIRAQYRHQPMVLFVGRLVRYKGAHVLIEAMQGLPAVALLVGEGPERSALRQKAGELGLAAKVRFLGEVPSKELAALYQACDLFVLPSVTRQEAFGVVQLEAMSCDKPVISTDLGTGVAWVNQHGETGLVVPPGDVSALRAAIQQLIAGPALRARMGLAGARRVRSVFTIDRMTESTLALYREVSVIVDRLPAVARSAKAGPSSTLHRRWAGAKRLLDLLLSACGLAASAPLWLVISALIKMEDRGPIFFAQERVGKDGRRFYALKFRSMIADAEARSGPVQSGANDPRVTRIGRVLRATAMDELPQLWNIFRGDMSFVGPRALRPGEIEVNGRGRLERLEDVPGFDQRCGVQPGLTGVAQIYAPRDIVRRHKFRYDRLYIRRRSFWLDVRLILLSFWITFRGTWETRGRKF
jgi:lipopolysaccharide/colanic/teichoic acid biosynthesis glycosyltransferase/glycosyltransferase involved in cell wall biosynthesis